MQLIKKNLPAHETKYFLLAAWCKLCFISGELHKKVAWIESSEWSCRFTTCIRRIRENRVLNWLSPSGLPSWRRRTPLSVMVPMTGYVPFWLILTLHPASDLVLLFSHWYEKVIMILFLHLNLMPLIIWGNLLAPLLPLIKWSNNTFKVELLS